jgi:hypothetical protein
MPGWACAFPTAADFAAAGAYQPGADLRRFAWIPSGFAVGGDCLRTFYCDTWIFTDMIGSV